MNPRLYWAALLTPPLLTALGVGWLTYAGLEALGDLLAGLRRRFLGRVALSTTPEGALLQVGMRRLRITLWDALPLAGGLLLALVWRAPLLSAWVTLLGAGATAIVYGARPRVTPHLRAEQELFIGALRSRYAVEQSLTAALQGATSDLEDPLSPLAQAAGEVVRRLRLGEPGSAALAPLAAQGRSLRRLTTVLGKVPWSAAHETQALLAEIESEARRRRRLADRAQVTLTVLRLTLRVLIVTNTVAAVVAALLPAWRTHYLARPGTYLVGTALAVVGWGYFTFRIRTLEESL
jgi:hypothetical protein